MLYTGKGDDGTTKAIGDKERKSKGSLLTETLGSMDEINSFLGLCKVKAKDLGFFVDRVSVERIVHNIQSDLFIIQAELAGGDMTITEGKVKKLEKIISAIDKKLPKIKNFFISGGSEISALFEFSRTLARRAERSAIKLCDDGERDLGKYTKMYLNRLSSLLYALARLSNHMFGIKEESPDYK